jgi:hypothetical protein
MKCPLCGDTEKQTASGRICQDNRVIYICLLCGHLHAEKEAIESPRVRASTSIEQARPAHFQEF